MIEAVLFDLDETLTDRSASIRGYAAVFSDDFASSLDRGNVTEVELAIASLDEDGYRPREEFYAALAEHLPWTTVPTASTIGEHWREWFPKNSVGRLGMHETLAALAHSGRRLGIVTNGTELTQSAKIEYLGLGKYVKVVVISEAAGYKKPEPEIFWMALDGVGTGPEATVFVGDHPLKDVVGASDAGLKSVWFEGGKHAWPSDLDPPRYRIKALEELVTLIAAGLDAA